MANKITEKCLSCGSCESECPNEAIKQGDDIYVIDPARCDGCEPRGGQASCKAVCSEDAIVAL